MSGMSNEHLIFRLASRADVPRIVQLLADDPLGAKRESDTDPLPNSYYVAYEAIEADPNQELVVACKDNCVAGVLQLTFIPYLTYQGGWRALIEGVRVAASERSTGIGEALLEWAINRAQERDCHLIQLTTDKTRQDAKRFYERLGFQASHEGMKRHLN